ncbi:unnamed protein product [Rhodiola kirilowii]
MAREIRDIIESVGLTDRITQLPDEVREYILGYLTISDAVRSSVLSQKWRYTWTKAVQLNFHFKEKMSVHRYFRLVGRVLLSHVGPVHKCVFKWDGHEKNSNLKGDINACLQTLSRKNIKDLTIFGREYVHSFELPPSIFDCLGLSSLTLGNCTLQNYIAFKGFPNLVRLNLSHVDIIGDMLEKVISKCPLEMLYISFCTFCSSEIDSRPRKNAISAPNLRVLDIVCYYNGLDYSYLKNTPNLKAASFWMAGEGRVPYDMMSNCYYILKSMPKVEVLTFDCRLHKNSASDIIPNTVPRLLENLKTLDLHCMDALSLSDRHGRLFVYDKDTWEAVIAYLDVVDKEEIKTSITTVCVTFGRDTAERVGADIAFIDIIISCCPALGNLVVNTSSSLKGSAKLQLSGALRRILMAGNSSGSDADENDRITKLPDEIIGHILGYLPICDAVRTSVLSRRWRCSWTKTVQLNLYFIDYEMSNERFFRLVLRVLVSHVGPIHKCVLGPSEDEIQEVTDVEGDVNAWLRLLSTMDVKDLTIGCHPDMERNFKLPPYVFQCLELSRLTLENCKLEYSLAFKGFPNLTRLDLSYVEINEDMLEKVISNCPLEMLFIEFCEFYRSRTNFRPCKNAISTSSLRVFDIVSDGGLYYSYLKYTYNIKVASLLIESDYNDDDCIPSGFDFFLHNSTSDPM